MSMIHTLKKTGLFAAALMISVAFVAIVVGQFRTPQAVDAGINHNFSGFAWSDMPTTSNEVSNPTGWTVGRGAGWISFNSLDTGSSIDYGVNVDAAGNISGTAWSEHVGWISFTNVAGCPVGTCQPRIETNGATKTFKGWARAMAYTDPQAGGWDGWISLNSANGGGGATYGWTLDASNNVTGYAWGGDVLGWISPYNLKVNPSAPALTLIANPSNIVSSNPLVTDLTYSTANNTPFSSCTLTTNPTTGSTTAGTPVHNRTMPNNYSLPTSSNQTIPNVRVYAPQTVYTLTCTMPGQLVPITATATVTVTDPVPSVSLNGPACVRTAGTNAQIVWSSANVNTCSISPSVGSVPTNGSHVVNVSSGTTYTISCSTSFTPPTVSASHTIAVDPSCQQTGTDSNGVVIPIFNEV